MKWFQMPERFGYRNQIQDVDDLGGPVDEPIDNNQPSDEIDFDPEIHDLDDEGNIIEISTGKPPGKAPVVEPRQLSADDISAAVRSALDSGKPPAQVESEKPLSPDELRQMIKYREVGESDLAILMDPEKPLAERAKALNDLLDARDQSNQILIRSMYEKLGGQFQSFQQAQAEQHRVAARDTFLGSVVAKYPALKDFQHAMPEIFEALRATGYKPQSAEEGLRALASFAQKTIRKFNPQFSLAPSTNGRRQMAGSINNGGRSSAPARGQQTPKFQQIW